MGETSRRNRSEKWDNSETKLLAESKKEAFCGREVGAYVWQGISGRISGRSADQCRRRWDTLVKVYNEVEAYCTQTERTHEDLNDQELASMKLATTYGREWYKIVKEVCDHRKGKERRHRDRAAETVSKRSRTPVLKTLPTAHPATTDDSVTTSVNSDFENNTVSQSRETPDFSENYVGRVATSMDPLGDVRVTEDVTVNTPPEVTDPSDVSRDSYVSLTPGPTSDRTSEFKEPSLQEVNPKLEREVNASRNQKPLDDGTAKTLSQIVEDAELEQAYPDLSDECSNDVLCNWAETLPEGQMSIEEYLKLNSSMSNMSLSKTETLAEDSASAVSEGTITRESKDNSILEALDTKSECVDLKAASKVIELQAIELGVYLCCRECMRKLKKYIEKVDGVQNVKFKYECDKVIHKVIVTAKAEPEVVLKHAQMSKKKVVLLSPKKLIVPKS